MVLKKLEELGYKPKKDTHKEKLKNETAEVLKGIENDETKKLIMNLLIEALAEDDPKEILIYGMFVKKRLSPDRGTRQKDKIQKTLDLLVSALGKSK